MHYLIPKMLGAISPDESMLDRDADGAVEKYFGVGLNGLMVVRSALESHGKEPKSILDLPCGYGRVMRFLRAAFPSAQIYASDVNKEAVDFCSANFASTPVHSTGEFDGLFDESTKFDLIWSGSLITHFSERKTREFLEFVSRHLSPNGIAVVTSHGEKVLKTMNEANRFGLREMDRINEVNREYSCSGYGYCDYPNMSDYGVAFISREWLFDYVSQINSKVCTFSEGAWAGQDVMVMART